MGKYGANKNIEVSVKVFENKNSEAKPTNNGGIFQMLGNAVATISVDGEVMFERLSGMVGSSYRDKAAFDKGECSMVVTYTNAYTADNGNRYDKVNPSEKMQSYLQVETFRALKEGFATPERDQHIADNADMDAEEYLDLAKSAAALAVSMKKESSTTAKKESGDAMAELDKELEADMG